MRRDRRASLRHNADSHVAHERANRAQPVIEIPMLRGSVPMSLFADLDW